MRLISKRTANSLLLANNYKLTRIFTWHYYPGGHYLIFTPCGCRQEKWRSRNGNAVDLIHKSQEKAEINDRDRLKTKEHSFNHESFGQKVEQLLLGYTDPTTEKHCCGHGYRASQANESPADLQ